MSKQVGGFESTRHVTDALFVRHADSPQTVRTTAASSLWPASRRHLPLLPPHARPRLLEAGRVMRRPGDAYAAPEFVETHSVMRDGRLLFRSGPREPWHAPIGEYVCLASLQRVATHIAAHRHGKWVLANPGRPENNPASPPILNTTHKISGEKHTRASNIPWNGILRIHAWSPPM
jgi:hypothetical protein